MKKAMSATAALVAATMTAACTFGTAEDPSGLEQMREAEILTIGIDEDTVTDVAYQACLARDEGANHRFLAEILAEQMDGLWSRRDVDEALNIWYSIGCPEYAAEG